MSGITFLKQNPSKLGWDSPIRKMACGLSFLLWLTLLQTSLAVNVPAPNGTVVTQILSATSSNPEVKVVEDRDLGKILVYPPQPKEFTVEIIARIMYPDDQYLEKISTVMVGGAGVTIESSEIRNSLILATLKVAPGASGGRFSITYENEDNPSHKGCNVRLLPVEVEELIEPEESAGCTGYDKDENALMVPMEGSNKIKVKISGAPADLLAKMKFVSEPAGKLTIAPQVPTAAEQELTLSGTAAALGVKVKLEIDGTKVDLFEADVMKKITKTIEIHAITEENDDVQKVAVGNNTGANKVCVEAGANRFRDTKPQGDDQVVGNNITTGADGVCNTTANKQNLVPVNVTTAASLQAYLNKKTWGNQANVHFTVTRTDHVVNYDLDRNGKLADPFLGAATYDEIHEIRKVAKAAKDYNIYYAKSVEIPFAITLSDLGSIDASAEPNPPLEHTNNVAAHEIGHMLGLGYHHHGAEHKDKLMHDTEVPPCGITRRDWRTANP